MATLWDNLMKGIGFNAVPKALRPITFGTPLPGEGSAAQQIQEGLAGGDTSGGKSTSGNGDTGDTDGSDGTTDEDDSQDMFGGLSKMFPFLLMMMFLFQFKGINYQSSPEEGTQFQFEYGRI